MRTGYLLMKGNHARRLMPPFSLVCFQPGGNILCRQMMLCILGVTHRPPHTVTTREGNAIAQHWVMRM